MRLLDRLVMGDFEASDEQYHKMLIESLSESQLVVADNVADYYHKQVADIQKMDATDFPNVMPPFGSTFIEMRFPRDTNFGKFTREGGLMCTVAESEQIRDYEKYSALPKDVRTLFEHPLVHYHFVGHLFVHKIGEVRPQYLGYSSLPVQKDGSVFSPDSNKMFIVNNLALSTPGGSEEDSGSLINMVLSALVFPALLAISFMHCRNVTMVKEGPPLPLSKKHQKRFDRPLLRYHVLKIDHMKKVLEREGHVSTNGLQKALGLCRGHFATYGMHGKGLLFGKHEGRFWIPDHKRGNRELGVVEKDYEVK